MSTSAELPAITCPTSLIASCAPLLGYQPRSCVVGFITGVPGRSGAVIVRMDLAGGLGAEHAAQDLARAVAGTGGRMVDLVAWVDDPDSADRDDLRSGPMLDRLIEALGGYGIEVPVVLTTNGWVWWSHDCPDVLCCGGSRPLDESVVTRVRAEYAYAGYAPLGSRDALIAVLDRDPARSRYVGRSLARVRPPADVERWRDARIRFLADLLVPGWPRPTGRRSAAVRAQGDSSTLDERTAARAVRGLADVPVRDIILLRLIGSTEPDPGPWRHTLNLLGDLVRCSPPGRGAPAATLLAIVAWMTGEGALATVALDRADDEDPGYRLARLTREVITRGVDPVVWRRSMSGLTEEECRRASPDPGLGGQRPIHPSVPSA